MRVEDIRQGDIVRVREFSDLAKEFGIKVATGSIPCPGYFVTRMKMYCGTLHTVEVTPKTNFDVIFTASGWKFYPDMVEPAFAERPEESESADNNISIDTLLYD